MAGLCLTLSAYARTTRRVRATRLRERRLSLPAGRRRGGGGGSGRCTGSGGGEG
jgi:hypothetical protein